MADAFRGHAVRHLSPGVSVPHWWDQTQHFLSRPVCLNSQVVRESPNTAAALSACSAHSGHGHEYQWLRTELSSYSEPLRCKGALSAPEPWHGCCLLPGNQPAQSTAGDWYAATLWGGRQVNQPAMLEEWKEELMGRSIKWMNLEGGEGS